MKKRRIRVSAGQKFKVTKAEGAYAAEFLEESNLNRTVFVASSKLAEAVTATARLYAETSAGKIPKGILIDCLVSPARAEDMLLSLQTAFEQRWVPKYGVRRARMLFFVQSAGAVAGFWIDWARRRLDFLRFFAR
ncbi:hypothetical protein [Bradyrhizobium pachyrhizi]|uniref:hypothetical protein n=1 Tax=Bradyrhizobium pachyrhizi TaxID=280333 RepID=UPI003D36CE99